MKFRDSVIRLIEQGCLEEAENLLRQRLSADAENGTLHGLQCNLLSKMGRFAEAVEHGRKAVTLMPNDADCHQNLGVVLYCMDQSIDAVNCFRRALQISPDHPQALSSLGSAMVRSGHVDMAEKCYRRAVAAAPEYLAAVIGYGSLCHRLGRLPTAIDYYRRALALRLSQPGTLTVQAGKTFFDTSVYEAHLWKTLAQLARAGVHAFAFAGTLLGLIREGGLLPHDKDIDIGLPYAELNAAHDCLLAHGWLEIGVDHGLINPRTYLYNETGLTLDLCAFTVESGTGMTLGGFWLENAPANWNRVTEYPALTLLQTRRPEGPIWALSEPERWLEALYGDWRTPDPDFDTVLAAKNLRGVSLLTQCYAFSRIFARWQQGDLTKALAATRHSLRHLPEDALLRQIAANLEDALAKTQKVESVPDQKAH